MITYNYGPRQIGKSTIIAGKYLEDPENTAVVCYNSKTADLFKDSFYRIPAFNTKDRNRNNIFSSYQPDATRSRTFKNVYFDEFDMFPSEFIRDQWRSWLIIADNIHIYTTPKYRRDANEYILIRLYKRYGRGTLSEYISQEFPEILMDEEYLSRMHHACDDIISDVNVKLCNMDIPYWWDRDQHISYLPEEQYKTEILGQLFK